MNSATKTPPVAAVGTGLSAIAASLTALLSALCCTGPAAYAVLGAGGVLTAARLAPDRPYLLAVAAISLTVGFVLTYRSRTRCSPRARRATRTLIWLAAVVTIAAAVAPNVLT